MNIQLFGLIKRVFSEETAYQITSILEGAVKRGTAKKLRDMKVPLAGKTGTTNKNYDAWFIGFTSNLVIGVYVGFDSPQTLENMRLALKQLYQFSKTLLKMLCLKKILKNLIYLKEFI